MDKVVTRVVNKAQLDSSLPFHRLVSGIMSSLQTGGSDSYKASLLQSLALELQKKQPQMRFRAQHDVVEALSLLISELEEEGSQILNLMTLKFKKDCRCQRDFLYESAFVKLQETCGDCGGRVEFRIVNAAPYLCLVEGSHENYRNEYSLQIGSRKLCFENIFFTNYSGNSHFGHYSVCRKSREQWLQISDSHVCQLKATEKPLKMPRVCLYKYVLQNPNIKEKSNEFKA